MSILTWMAHCQFDMIFSVNFDKYDSFSKVVFNTLRVSKRQILLIKFYIKYKRNVNAIDNFYYFYMFLYSYKYIIE